MKRSLSCLAADVLQNASYHVYCQEEAADHHGDDFTMFDRWISWWQGAAAGFFNDGQWIPLWWRITRRDVAAKWAKIFYSYFFEDDMEPITKSNVPTGWESVGTDHEDSYPVPKGWAVAETSHDHSDDPIYHEGKPSA